MNRKYIKLSQWAKDNGYSYHGAFRLHKKGLIPNTKVLPTGTILVQVEEVISTPLPTTNNEYIIYCRVSSSKQKDDLNRQVERMSNFAINNGYIIKHTYKEIASGMNDNRKVLNALLENHKDCALLIEHKDRLTRFGYHFVELLCKSKNINIIIANESTTDKEDLVNDLVSVITSFCAKLYGSRKSKHKTESIIKGIYKED